MIMIRVEHPQRLIDSSRYGEEHAAEVQRGKGKIPVADYKLNIEVPDDTWQGSKTSGTAPETAQGAKTGTREETYIASRTEKGASEEVGRDKRDDTNTRTSGVLAPSGGGGIEEYGGSSTGRAVPAGQRGVYSFCMCPGGQIVCTSTNPEELCLNGMSFR
jgi:hypothetical protein